MTRIPLDDHSQLLVLLARADTNTLAPGEAAKLRRLVEQLAAGRATWMAKAKEMEADRDRQVEAKVGLLGQLGNALADKTIAEADRDRVQQKACRTAEALRLNSQRLDAVLADRENERAARTAEEKCARTDEAVLARVRQMADYWEQQLPDVIRTPAVVSALRAVLDQAQQPTT